MTTPPPSSTIKPLKKAVFPVAGLGTRFLPATAVMPKEMLTVGDKPLIQHAVEEAKAAGIEDFIFITGHKKEMLEQHFDPQPALMATLESRGKTDLLKALRDIALPAGALVCARQEEPLGLGHAIWCARDIVGDEPFAVLLPDVVIKGEVGCLSQMVSVYEKTGGNVIALNQVAPSETKHYGIVDIDKEYKEKDQNICVIKGMVEKPDPKTAPSTLAITGRYILQPSIFNHLGAFERGAGNEIQLTDSMKKMLGHEPFYGLLFQGKDYDCGSRLGFIEANIAFGLADPIIGAQVRKILDKYA